MDENKQVAMTIIEQMGGYGRLTAMVGAKQFVCDKNSLTFKFMRSNGVNCIGITLNSLDLYDIKFYYVTAKGFKVKSEHNSMYAESLKGLFEKETGLYLSL